MLLLMGTHRIAFSKGTLLLYFVHLEIEGRTHFQHWVVCQRIVWSAEQSIHVWWISFLTLASHDQNQRATSFCSASAFCQVLKQNRWQRHKMHQTSCQIWRKKMVIKEFSWEDLLRLGIQPKKVLEKSSISPRRGSGKELCGYFQLHYCL